MVRRIGNSLDMTAPIRKLPTARCQYSSEPVIMRPAITAETAACNASPAIIRYLRFIRSDTTPIPYPNSMGMKRRKNVNETRNGESVSSSASSAITSISSHIIVPVIQPTAQSLRNWGLRRSFGWRCDCNGRVRGLVQTGCGCGRFGLFPVKKSQRSGFCQNSALGAE